MGNSFIGNPYIGNPYMGREERNIVRLFSSSSWLHDSVCAELHKHKASNFSRSSVLSFSVNFHDRRTVTIKEKPYVVFSRTLPIIGKTRHYLFYILGKINPGLQMILAVRTPHLG